MFIEADLHCHSVASTHAYSTVKELAESANENGLELFALTDHAPEMSDAPHVWHFHNLHVIPRILKNVIVLRGVEADIKDRDGLLDMTDEDLEKMDWVVASCHGPVIDPGTAEENTDTYINVMKRYKCVDMIGHPTARSFPVNFDRLIKACKEYGKFPELNESSAEFERSKPEVCIEMLKACMRYSVPIVVSTDCHFCDIIGKTPKAEELIKAAGFPDELVFNRKASDVLEFLAKKKNLVIEREK